MKTSKDFNDKYKEYIDGTNYGIDINIPSVLEYVDVVFRDLIKIEGFKYQQIKIKFGMCRVHTNLDELLPFVGRIIHQELEEKVNFILKVEHEIEKRMNQNVTR
jgi:hypothetical protein